MHRTILTGGWSLAVLGLSLPTVIHAEPLPSATWTETMSIHTASTTNEYSGQDAGVPEALSETLIAYDFTMEGDVTFGQPGPPFVTTHVSGQRHEQTYGEFVDYSVNSRAIINFAARIVQTQTPPVAVDYVPILVAAHGSISAVATCSSSSLCFGSGAAGARIILTEDGTEVFNKTETINVASGPLQQLSLDAAKPLSVRPGTILQGLVDVGAAMSTIGTVSASGSASLGPTFEITSAFIPGTEYQYRDFFQIEYSPGYWALGNPTPVAPTTWGRIKTLYSNP